MLLLFFFSISVYSLQDIQLAVHGIDMQISRFESNIFIKLPSVLQTLHIRFPEEI